MGLQPGPRTSQRIPQSAFAGSASLQKWQGPASKWLATQQSLPLQSFFWGQRHGCEPPTAGPVLSSMQTPQAVAGPLAYGHQQTLSARIPVSQLIQTLQEDGKS